ncbi:ricin-type beta-trefoil lectin domain protein [Actinomadura sp. NPDC047616]|uniref:ricin-type beta-trefoil lectin domain protein n=1 Tax=Actinomadura sp. NPDC047616 TaxID=3155914 RepID=UPI0033E55444
MAHQDDDLLSLNPAIRDLIRAGCPVSTVYLTAGDGERGADFVANRENGVREAYAAMAGARNHWSPRPVQVGDRTLRSYRLLRREVRLTFMELPDGRPAGDRHPSLLGLFTGAVSQIGPLNGARAYNEAELLATLDQLVVRWNIGRILTLDPDNTRFGYDGWRTGGVDHSDHGVTARYFRKVAYRRALPVRTYLGYTMSKYTPNLTGGDTTDKTRFAKLYHKYELCGTTRCLDPPEPPTLPEDYSNWVARQYPTAHRPPNAGEIVSHIGDRATDREHPELCLDADHATGRVRTLPCDGTSSQQWTLLPTGHIASGPHRTLCLDAGTDDVTATRCASGAPQQIWQTRSGTISSMRRCLWQDDAARKTSRLRLTPCPHTVEPETSWQWQAPRAGSPAGK